MKTMKLFASAILSLTMAAPAVVIAQGPPPRPGYHSGEDWQRQPWAMAPGRYDAVRQQGFRDGMYGARKDVENGRRPTPNNRDEYRDPHVPRHDVRAYRDGFREGYNVAMRHFMRGGYWR
ncbi:MAG: hypothetical protein JSS87_10280 [Acidobacteria bacterium]|nr:hypothetical protein [Acidobacteriota bacterium]